MVVASGLRRLQLGLAVVVQRTPYDAAVARACAQYPRYPTWVPTSTIYSTHRRVDCDMIMLNRCYTLHRVPRACTSGAYVVEATPYMYCAFAGILRVSITPTVRTSIYHIDM